MSSIDESLYNLNGIRIGVGFGLFLLVLSSLLLPYWILQYFLKRSLDNVKKSNVKMTAILSFFNCLSAGVFISTGLLDIYPEVIQKMDNAFKKYKYDTSFPVASFVVLCGLFLIMYIEEALHILEDWLKTRHTKRDASCTLDDSPSLVYNTFDNGDSEPSTPSDSATNRMNSVSIVVLIIALATHSIFEGLALGLQNNGKALLLLFIALSFHKAVISVTLGLEMAQLTLKSVKVILCTLVFAGASPIGLIIGAILQSMEHGNQPSVLLCSAVLEGLACGTFLFIVFFEILPRELRPLSSHRFTRIVALSFGFLIVTLLIFCTH